MFFGNLGEYNVEFNYIGLEWSLKDIFDSFDKVIILEKIKIYYFLLWWLFMFGYFYIVVLVMNFVSNLLIIVIWMKCVV